MSKWPTSFATVFLLVKMSPFFESFFSFDQVRLFFFAFQDSQFELVSADYQFASVFFDFFGELKKGKITKYKLDRSHSRVKREGQEEI